MDYFSTCKEISDLLNQGEETQGREKLILLLDYLSKNNLPYTPLINHLIKLTGLYPYIDINTASWVEQYTYEVFKVDVGLDEPKTLHREQSRLLSKLVDGQNLAVSAPTSFGKSFVVDALFKIKQPNNVVILVPTIALADETRRRLYRKFSSDYKVITTSGVEVSDKNIFIFPQERALSYISQLNSIDILIIDEFYKADSSHDKERAAQLQRAIMKLRPLAKQKYYLMPNISKVEDNIFTADMIFIKIDFNTVYLNVRNLHKDIQSKNIDKNDALKSILKDNKGKSLIYAGTHAKINKLSNLIMEAFPIVDNPLLQSFAEWLDANYQENWGLTSLVKRGFGIHSGKLHRSLSQLQVKLFDDRSGLSAIISTSSIIEGVNTSAENVIVWHNKNGHPILSNFEYKNIIGRSGRMFKHFVGNVFILSPPPKSEDNSTLTLPISDNILGYFDEGDTALSNVQIDKVLRFRSSMSSVIGSESLTTLLDSNSFQTANTDILLSIAKDIKDNVDEWNSLSLFYSNDPNDWTFPLHKTLQIKGYRWPARHGVIVKTIKTLSNGWEYGLDRVLRTLSAAGVDIDKFFEIERAIAIQLASLLHDINLIVGVLRNGKVDISPFVTKLSYGFLPPVVYQLEEYGLPRMLSKKIHNAGILELDRLDLNLHDILNSFKDIGSIELKSKLQVNATFESYIIDNFFDGIS